MTSDTVGNKKGDVFNLKYNGVDFSRASKYKIKLIYVYVLSFVKWHAHMDNIYSTSKTQNLGAKSPFMFFQLFFYHCLHSTYLSLHSLTWFSHIAFIINP